MEFYDGSFAFVVGFAIALLIIVIHIIVTFVTRAYFDVSQPGLLERDPKAYDLLYRAKQHAIKLRKIEPADDFKGRLMAIYLSFQPDPRYIRLERNLAKLTDSSTVSLTASKFKSALDCCYKDIQFLNDMPPKGKKHNFILELAKSIASRAFLPTRNGIQELFTVEARTNLKNELEGLLDSYKL